MGICAALVLLAGAGSCVVGQELLGGAGLDPVPADYNGDGATELAVYQQPTGLWYVYSLSGGLLCWAQQWGRSGFIPVVGDYDGDGNADFTVYNETSGMWYGYSLTGNILFWAQSWGGPEFVPVSGDYDGDGRADLTVYNETYGLWFAYSLAGALIFWSEWWGGSGLDPVPGDYDGDGCADLAVYRQSTGSWYIRTATGTIICWAEAWGGMDQTTVPGDFDGDGIADKAVFDNSSAGWSIKPSGTNQPVSGVSWGWPGVTPVSGDFDSDGADDLAVYHEPSGSWYHTAVIWTNSPQVTGNVYYVATTGSDSNSGTLTAPWATPGYGSRQLQAGDTLVILGGTYDIQQYDQDDIVPQVSGSANAWIAIIGETNNRPVLRGSHGLRAAVDTGGKSYIKLENLELTSLIDTPYSGGLRQGIEAGGSAAGGADVSHIMIKDVYIHHVDQGSGINFSGDMHDVQVIGTRISHACMGGIIAPQSYGRAGWVNVVITNCYFGYSGHFYNGEVHDDVSLYDRPDGFGIEDSCGPVTIANTTAEHNFGDGLDSKSSNTTIRCCIVANNSCDGVKLWRGDSRIENTLIYGRGDGNTQTTPWAPIVIDSDNANDSFVIMNVTVDDQLGGNYVAAVQYDNPDVPISLTLRNTIFSARGPSSPVYIAQAVNAEIDHNLFYVPASSYILVKGGTSYDSSQVGLIGPGNLYGNPLFVATGFGTNGDYHLQSGSPAINSGSSTGAPATDLDGRVRPQSAVVDIGAYEH